MIDDFPACTAGTSKIIATAFVYGAYPRGPIGWLMRKVGMRPRPRVHVLSDTGTIHPAQYRKDA